FFYNAQQIKLDEKVSLNVENKSIEEILDGLFQDKPITYKVIDRRIVLYPKSEDASPGIMQQSLPVKGKVTSHSGEPVPGATVLVKGTMTGTVTDLDGNYQLTDVPGNAILVFSFVGLKTEEIEVNGQSVINMMLLEDAIGIEEVVAIGYGIQKKSDITGTVASLSQDRLELVPNVNVAQAIQGAVSGIQISTNSAGAESDDVSILIRGRNSIKASNSPLIVVDGFPYSGSISDVNPSDIKSIEILKDASSTAIYGSRGANGVILVTTKLGKDSKPQISYDGYYSVQKMINFPDIMTGDEFYEFKMIRDASTMTQTEEDIYNDRSWSDWVDLGLRNGKSQQHNISVSGGTKNVKYFVSGNILDVQGLAINDDYQRISSRINIETTITDWLKLGTMNTLTYDDKSGIGPSFSAITYINPLSKAFEDDGSLAIYPNKENPNTSNPLQGTLAADENHSYQVVSNNFLKVDFPFVKGLQYTLNGGVRKKFSENNTYYGRDTKRGLDSRGDASMNYNRYTNYTLENILNYNREFGKHNLFLTGLYSYEEDKREANQLDAYGFPNDVLTWYAATQAELIKPSFEYSNTKLLSQMLRFNYTYDNRYLFTVTGRRDGYSGFGKSTKWGTFPSVALGWNMANESFFFSLKETINTLKFRASWGKNGNQAVGAYETISRLSDINWISGSTTMPGYRPSKLGEDNLGWETTESLNFGVDFGLLKNRITGDLNYYISNTSDLLLSRTISPVHGITSVTQNIGETKNSGFEFSVNSMNVNVNDFKWSTSANLSVVKNEIVSLYGILDEDGVEMDDITSRWFIGEPIRVNYDFEVLGVWQLYEADEAAKYNSQPGFTKLNDTDGDYDIDDDDKMILGQRDPKVIWGMTNTFEYKNFLLRIFMHGVDGVTKENDLRKDRVYSDISQNTIKKNWWTPENPTNEFYMNHPDARFMGGGSATYYEDASYIRIKDITLAYNLPNTILERIKMKKVQLYFTGRNLFTITSYGGMDPELDEQRDIPLQKEFVFGLNIGL
ncbi:MAG: TonB-dependent receptor, partial [Marinifilaceae bacterium]|nr:TonB-dependent receptor [Marinifilaceae bacterium]